MMYLSGILQTRSSQTVVCTPLGVRAMIAVDAQEKSVMVNFIFVSLAASSPDIIFRPTCTESFIGVDFSSSLKPARVRTVSMDPLLTFLFNYDSYRLELDHTLCTQNS